ncbi:MAG: hypothetical protein ACR5LG_06970 [Sodalis sp. (in: enterobacteria)]
MLNTLIDGPEALHNATPARLLNVVAMPQPAVPGSQGGKAAPPL